MKNEKERIKKKLKMIRLAALSLFYINLVVSYLIKYSLVWMILVKFKYCVIYSGIIWERLISSFQDIDAKGANMNGYLELKRK